MILRINFPTNVYKASPPEPNWHIAYLGEGNSSCFFSKEGPRPFHKGDNQELAKINRQNFKNLPQSHLSNFNQTWHRASLWRKLKIFFIKRTIQFLNKRPMGIFASQGFLIRTASREAVRIKNPWLAKMAHGPHCSPEKPVQTLYTFTQSYEIYHNIDEKKIP